MAVLVPAQEIESRQVGEVIDRIRELRERTRKPYTSTRSLRDSGRKR